MSDDYGHELGQGEGCVRCLGFRQGLLLAKQINEKSVERHPGDLEAANLFERSALSALAASLDAILEFDPSMKPDSDWMRGIAKQSVIIFGDHAGSIQ